MPIAKLTAIHENVAWGLWKISETEEELLQLSSAYSLDFDELASISHPVKRKEWLAGKLCLIEVLKKAAIPFQGIYRSSTGKPFLNNAEAFISLSHAYPYATAIVSTKDRVGIDIEPVHDKLARIAPRFMSTKEMTEANGDLRKLCSYWTAKEALYKAVGQRGITFATDMEISPLVQDFSRLSGIFRLDSQTLSFRLQTYVYEKNVICFNY